MEIDSFASGNVKYVFFDEAGFNLNKKRRRGRNIIGERATVETAAERGGNITICAAMSEDGFLYHEEVLGAFNSKRLLGFLDHAYGELKGDPDVVEDTQDQTAYVFICDNVRFHKTAEVKNWFDDHSDCMQVFLPPYSPFLNPIEEFFSAWRWRVYDHDARDQASLFEAMSEACSAVRTESFRGWMRHSRQYFPRCIAKEDIIADVDEMLWPRRERFDVE